MGSAEVRTTELLDGAMLKYVVSKNQVILEDGEIVTNVTGIILKNREQDTDVCLVELGDGDVVAIYTKLVAYEKSVVVANLYARTSYDVFEFKTAIVLDPNKIDVLNSIIPNPHNDSEMLFISSSSRHNFIHSVNFMKYEITSLAKCPGSKRRNPSLVALGGDTLLFIGGYRANGDFVKECYRYDIDDDWWCRTDEIPKHIMNNGFNRLMFKQTDATLVVTRCDVDNIGLNNLILVYDKDIGVFNAAISDSEQSDSTCELGSDYKNRKYTIEHSEVS